MPMHIFLTLNNLVLIIFLALAVYRSVVDAKEYQEFKKLKSTLQRQKVFKKWLLGSFLLFGVGGVVFSVLAGVSLSDIGSLPSLFIAELGLTEFMGLAESAVFIIILLAMLAGQTMFFIKRNFFPVAGDIGAMLPRNKAEQKYGYLLSINAGIVEELSFRFLLPVLFYGSGMSASAALIVAIVVFGLMHAYQGLIGVGITMLMGFVFTSMYVTTGSILLPIIVHVAFDLRMFVMGPYLKQSLDSKKAFRKRVKYSRLRAILGLPASC